VTERVLRIFVSSPSDVASERSRVKLVADRLNAELEGRVRLDVLRWEDAFYTAAHSFQEAIDAALGNMSATDMVLCIVWKRAGLKLNPGIWHRADGSAYESGTVLEFETAVEVSRTHNGTPDVYLFRKTADVLLRADRADEEMEQYQLLQSVWKRWTETAEGYNTAGYQSFGDADDFETKLEACLRQWLERRGVVAKGPVWDRTTKGSPFRGLAAFEAAHAPVFFGRESAIARAAAKLRQAPFLLLIGASGSGKSSLMRAGLVPRITAPGVIADVDLWRTAIVTPSTDPPAELAQALFADTALRVELRAGDFTNPHLLAELFAGGKAAAVAPIRAALVRAAQARQVVMRYDAPRPARLLIAIDQVERLFVEAAADKVEAFAALLRALVEADLASVIAALRSDTYGRFQSIPAFVALLDHSGATLDLLPPSSSELEEIVTRPVAACHPPLAYESDRKDHSLAEVLVADAKGGDALPLLQMTLQRLFEAEARRGDGVLRFADYPGMAAAVTRTTEEVVGRLDKAALAALPALITAFVRDVAIDPAGGLEALTVVPVKRAEFERGDPARQALIEEFVTRRLLTTEDADGAVRLRPVHESLLRVVPAAVAIIKENAALIRVRHTLEPMVADWTRAAHDAKDDFLATSPALIAGAAQLAERFGPELPADMKAFIAGSLAADARRRDVERSRQRRILMATAAGLVVALALASLAGWQWQVAKVQRQRAEASLTAATDTANTLVFELAQEFRNRGLPVDIVRKILNRARDLQRQLTGAGEMSPSLLNSEAAALCELSTTLRSQGDLKEALETADTCRAGMEKLAAADLGNTQWQRQLAAAYQSVGDALRDAGRREEALAAYRKSREISAALAATDPANVGWQSDLATSDERIGDLLAVAGQRDAALDAYQKALAAIEHAAGSGSSDVEQHLTVIYNKIGDTLASAGRRTEALAAYRNGLAVVEKLAESEPDNTLWQSHLAFAWSNIGDLLSGEEALAAYGKALAIRLKLATSDSGNATWQRDLAASYSSIGDVMKGGDNYEQALDNYRKSLAIIETLAAANPENPQWQRSLSVGDNKIGDILGLSEKWDGALEAYRKGLAIREQLANADPGNTARQYDVAFSEVRVAQALTGTKQFDAALASYRSAVVILKKLAAGDPGNVEWAHLLSVDYNAMGTLLTALGRRDEAIESYRNDLAIAVTLAGIDPGNAEWQHDLWASYYKLGRMQVDAKRPDEARASLASAVAVLAKLTTASPQNVRWQTELVATLVALAPLGGDASNLYKQALAILHRLDAEGRLPADKKGWIPLLEAEIGRLPK
jgi:tetratricopeptide (TPR) repeat protein